MYLAENSVVNLYKDMKQALDRRSAAKPKSPKKAIKGVR